ncbi:type II toxin-antitoxin system RelE/ParE family toxin [Rheinheimera lutimaris]|uniref:type II toxin-antitoxin system RelE/ParE family toxin n=1 Tax=Rheinheimera lutimaris TaxID=2740584 RepID=UPI001E561AD8|nr:type II toxin-antitoxin system RelE/ParE family toxin [Rheinheimera lutimaris]
MYKVRLSNLAKEDLRRIYYYGVQHFGQQQADSYFYTFFSMFEQIAKNPLLYQ